MGFSELKKEVLDKAERESSRILKEGSDSAASIKKEIESEAKEAESKADEDIIRIQEMIERREIASSRLESKKMLLMAKKELVESAFKKAISGLSRKLGAQERKKLIEKLVNRAETEIKIAKIHCNNTDSRSIADYPTEESDMLGGIIAENEDGSVTVDYSFESMIDEINDSELPKITEILFK